jgi:hypothetical protein
MSEHDFEPIRGLPGVPPQGEEILWQGAPDWKALACEAFHVRAVAAYFGLMLAWRAASAISAGTAPLAAVESALLVAPVALAGLGTLAFLAWINARTTVYTITNRRVVLRFGAALTKAINIPFTIIDSAAMKAESRGEGDIALALKAPNKIAFLQLWPHARPWRVSAPQPSLRAIADAPQAALILAAAMEAQVVIERGRPEPARLESKTAIALAGPEAMAAS